MILAIDVGNTNIVLGGIENGSAAFISRLSTDTKPTVTYIEYGSDGREVGRMGIPNGSIFMEIDR